MLSWFWSMFRWLAFKTVWFHCYHLHLQVMLHRSQGRGLSSFGIRHVKPYIWAWTLTSYLPVIYRWVSKVSHSFPLKHIKTTILRCCFYSIYNIHIHLQMNCPKKNISGTRHTWDSPWPCLTNAAAKVRVAPAECGDAGVLHAFPGGSKGGFSSAGGIEVDSTWFNMIQPMTGWWFHTSFIFSIIYGYIWDNPSHWLSYFPRVGQPPDQKTVGIWCRNCATSQIWSMRGCETNCQVGFRPWRDSNSSEIPDIEMEQALFGFESATKIQVWEVEL